MNVSNHVLTSHRIAPVFIAAGTVMLLLTGCTSSTGASPTGSASEEVLAAATASVEEATTVPVKISETTPLGSVPPKDKVVVFVGGTSTPDAEALEGVQDAAALLGWQTKSFSFDAADISTFDTAMQQALRESPDYVVESGIGEDLFSKSTVDDYRDAKVPILAINVTPIPTEAPFVPVYGGTNAFLRGGEVLADWFVADSKGTGKVLNVNITSYPILTAFSDRFDEQVKSTCPSCTTTKLPQTFSDLVNGSIPANVVSQLRSDPSIKYVVFDNSAETNGLDAALGAAGLTDVKAIGFAIDPSTIASIDAGKSAKAFMAYNFRYNGWASVDTAARLAIDETATNPDSVAPTLLVTAENSSALSADALFRGPEDGLEQFAKLWGVHAP